MEEAPLLVIDAVSKRFASTHALDAVSFEVARGKIVGLAGENGAGKSTLIKILCGVHAADSGQILLDGRVFRPHDPEEAEHAGISVFHQEIPICPNLSIAANVFLGPSMPRRGLAPDWKVMNRRCIELYESLLGEDIDPKRLIRYCTAAEKQLALLVRVLSRNARIVILDEPTTALTPPEVARLFSIILRLQDQGITFIFVSHMLEELMDLSDTITVLRDGKKVGSLAKGEYDRRMLSELIAGRTLSTKRAAHRSRSSRPILEVDELGLENEFRGVSFSLGRGEILGIAGLQGSGRSSLARALFGAPPADSGAIRIDGKAIHIGQPRDAIRFGVGYIPEDRKLLGIFDDMDVKTNLCIAGIDRFSRWGILRSALMRKMAGEMREAFSIKMRDVDAPVRSLSGGNQQKVLISRWLSLKPRILVMNEPTRGVDVGAKQEITDLVLGLAGEGYTFVISSAELDELIHVADQILVMNRGQVSERIPGDEATKERIILAATTRERN